MQTPEPTAAAGQPAKHTPGPWHWDGNTLMPVAGDPTTSAVHSILDAEGGYGYLGSKPADTLREIDACRRLIAAAPDLLAALQLAVNEMRAMRSAVGAGLLTDKAVAAAEAAIAKASGSAE